jgi:hypothetical protein
MTKRSEPFEKLFNMPIGGEAVIPPNINETGEHALSRLKLWASKQKPHERAYRMRIDGEVIRVQRTPMGRNTPLSDWLLMKAGDRLLLKTKPTAADIKKAWGTAEHLNSPRGSSRKPGERNVGQWTTALDREGRLFSLCITDKDDNTMAGHIDIVGPSTVGWNGEWP